MSEALVPASAEPVVTDRGADVVLPALIVDAGPDAVRCQATSGIDPPATPKTDPSKKRRMLLKWWVFR